MTFLPTFFLRNFLLSILLGKSGGTGTEWTLITLLICASDTDKLGESLDSKNC